MPVENASQSPKPEPFGRDTTSKPTPNGNGHATKGVPGSAAALGLDLNVSIMALKAANPDGYQHFMFLDPVTSRNSGWIFAPGSWAEKREMIEAEQDAGNNAYFMVNEPFPPGTGKLRVDEPHPGERDIAKITGVPFDADIAKSIAGAAAQAEAHAKIVGEIKTVASGLFTAAVPGITLDSGNGGQGEFILPEPLDATPGTIEKAKRAGRGVQAHFRRVLGADVAQVDSVWDVCRVMRIPGTVNFPTADKIQRGRVTVASTLIAPLTGATATLDEILAAFPAGAGAAGNGPDRSPKGGAELDREVAALMKLINANIGVLEALDGAGYDALPEELREKFEAALTADPILKELWGDGGFGDGSGSDQVYALAMGLVRAGGKVFSVMDFGSLARVWDHAVGGKGVTRADGQGNGDPRSIARNWAKAQGSKAERVFGDVDTDDPEVEEAAREAKEADPIAAMPLPTGATPFPFEDDEAKIPRRAWLYGKRLIRGYASATVAAGGGGKSSLTMVEIASMVSGKEILGHKPRVPLRVWLWNGEDDQLELLRRFQAIFKHYGITKADVGDRLFTDSGRTMPIVIAATGRNGVEINKKMAARIKEIITRERIDVMVVDPFVSSHRVSENDNMAIDAVVKTWVKLAEECGCAVDLVHHVRKPGGGSSSEVSIDDARGASAFVDATRSARVISPMTPKMAQKMKVTNHKAYFAIQHGATKANMAPPSSHSDWYRFVSISLNNGTIFPDDGCPDAIDGDSIGVVEKWTPPILSVTDDPAVIAKAQAEIAKGAFRKNSQSPDWVGHPVAEALGVDMGTEPHPVSGKRKLTPAKSASDAERDARGLVSETIEAWVKDGWLSEDKRKNTAKGKDEVFIVNGEQPDVEPAKGWDDD